MKIAKTATKSVAFQSCLPRDRIPIKNTRAVKPISAHWDKVGIGDAAVVEGDDTPGPHSPAAKAVTSLGVRARLYIRVSST